MLANARRLTLATVLIAIAALPLVVAVRQAQGQTAQTKQVMQQKLAESQQLLAALVTSNWAALNQRSQSLQSLTKAPGWQVLQTPEFRDYTAAFQRATQAVAMAAAQRDQRTALTAYNQLVASCVECHRYVARSRIASAVR
jgi:hypothetical protein